MKTYIKFLCLLGVILNTINVSSSTIYIDGFQGAQGNFVFQSEYKLDVKESLLFGWHFISRELTQLDIQYWVFDAAYRRYVRKGVSSGVFYSFGLKIGNIEVNKLDDKENETIIMPYYDIGIKTKLSKNWHHSLRIEASYTIAYTERLNIDDILGLQVSPFFSFGYNF